MPPRIPSHRVSQPSSTSCFCTRPRLGRESPLHARCFHSSPANNTTRQRRDMFDWLNGPGKAFREPLPASSNYLSAYDKQGNLTRARQSDRDKKQKEEEDAELAQSESELQAKDQEAGISEEEVMKRAEQRSRRRLERKDEEEREGIPKERERDLRPYPLNTQFKSQPVLSEELRNKIHELIVDQGIDLKSVSAAFGIDVRRVAAVVRLGEVERNWIKEGKTLAKPYNKAVLDMLPQTHYRPSLRTPPAHESINDLPVHPYTRQQIFVPTSESRAFTRVDAAKTFHPKLKPADERISHPELVQIAKWENEGHSRETRQQMMREKDAEAAAKREQAERKKAEWESKTKVVVKGRRWDFVFRDVEVSAKKTGKDGRGRDAVGLRYGFPLEDRKKGQFKMPTKVE